MRNLRLDVLVVVLTLGAAGPVWAQRPSWAGAVDSIVRQELAQTGAPGAQVAIVQGGRLAYAAGYGVADIESGRPVTERTLFQVAGVTGVFTAALMAELHARGVVDLDSPLRRYLPQVGVRAGDASLRALLSMSGGWINSGDLAGPQEEVALSALYSTIGDSVVMAEPGRVYSYSNPGYSAVGLVAERVTGRAFADAMDSLLFRPLGMRSAAYRPALAATRDASQPHVGPAGQPARVLRPAPANASGWPTGFLYVTAPELARLSIALMGDGTVEGRRVLRPEALRQLRRAVIPVAEIPADSFALGVHVTVAGGRRRWEKAGGMPGWESQLTMWPDDRFAVVASFNRQTALPARVIEAIARRVAGIAPRPLAGLAGERDPTDAERAALVGRYGQTVVTSEYFEQDGRLMMRLGPATLPVRVTADGSRIVVRPPAGPMRVTAIVRDATGAVRFLVREGRAYRKL